MGSVYASKGAAGGSVYAQSGTTAGSVYAGGKAAPGPARKSRGGLLGAVEGAAHFVAQKTDLAARDVKAIPGGLVQFGAAFGHDLKASVEHPERQIGPTWSDLVRHPLRQTDEHGSELTPLLQEMTVQSGRSLAHPLRDPFQTALTLLPLLTGGASTVARAGAVADAARAGDLAGAAKAAATRPVMPPRFLKSGEHEVPLTHSHQALYRAAQAVHDRLVQHALDNRPEGKLAGYGQWRIGNALDEEARVQQRMREAPAAALDAAGRRLTKARGAGRLQQAALELASVNTPAEKAAAYHLAQAEKGVDVARNTAVAKLYQAVHEKGLLAANEHGDVIVNAVDHPNLAAADMRLANVQGRGDEILARYHIREPEALQARNDAPGRIRAGATYESPTPGKMGKSPAVERASQRVASLQRRFDQFAARDTGGYTEAARPRTEQEAAQRLAALENRHASFEKAIYNRLFTDKLTPDELAEQRYRNVQNARAARQEAGRTRSGARSGASAWKSIKRQLVREDRWNQVEAEIQRTLATMGNHPSAQRFLHERDEIFRLQQALETSPDEAFGARQARTADQLGTVTEARYNGPTRPRLERIGGALSVARDDLQRLEQQATNRVKPTGIVGGKSARPGRGFVSYAASEKRAPTSAAAKSASAVVGEAKTPINSKAFTGHNVEHGVVPNDIVGQAARHYRQILRFLNTTERRNAAIRTGSNVRRSERDVLAKVPGEEHAKLGAAIEEALGREKPTADTLAGLHAALEAHRESMVPGLADRFAADAQHPVGTLAADAATARDLPAPNGYRWVDRNALGELARQPVGSGTGVGARIGRGLDNVNSAVTAATVYFKIGHLGTRALTNAATNIIQGSARPSEIARSVHLWTELADEDKARALAASGQHSIQALPHEGTGRVARIATKGASWWARRIDSPFRFNAIAFEARRAGYGTPAEFRGLLDRIASPHDFNMSAAERSKVMGVANRANRAAIAYDRLSDFEKRYITRAFWFYPWTSAATRFAVATALEHPYKAGALTAAGTQGRETQQADLGLVPSYEAGLFKVGGSPDRPQVADFSTFSPFATSADVLEAAARPGDISGFLNPVYAATNALINAKGLTGRPSTSPLKDAAAQALSPMPESQILTALLARHTNQGRRMFPSSPGLYGTQSQILRALAGPGLPRVANRYALNNAARLEQTGR